MLETTLKGSVSTLEISATEPDWSREHSSHWWNPGQKMLKSIRAYQKWKSRGVLGSFFCRIAVLQHRFWSIVAGTDIPLNCQIDGGLLLPHPNGIVIHPSATIGPNCLILQQVTVVADVSIGGHVDIGAGAKIIRAVSIGNHARIGANAVVLDNVPEGATVIGIPARIVSQKHSS